MAVIAEDWTGLVRTEFAKPYYRELSDFVRSEYVRGTVYPPKEQIFEAFRYTKREDVKVVILGQDPYHRLPTYTRSCTTISAAMCRTTATS